MILKKILSKGLTLKNRNELSTLVEVLTSEAHHIGSAVCGQFTYCYFGKSKIVLNKLKLKIMAKQGTPKRDGSGQGTRQNQGRGGCKTTKKVGKGKQV